jgi:hypothetical protein
LLEKEQGKKNGEAKEEEEKNEREKTVTIVN